MHISSTVKFYLDHTKQQVTRHKCNSCLGICSIFIVVVISASGYTLVQDTPVAFYRQAEQIYGQYDMILSPPVTGQFLDYPLMASLLEDQHNLQLHSPRISWNGTGSILYPPSCTPSTVSLDDDLCTESIVMEDDPECTNGIKQNVSIWLIDFEKEHNMNFGRTFDSADTPKYGEVILTVSAAEDLGVRNIGERIHIAVPLNSTILPLLPNYLNDRYFTNISSEAPQILKLIDFCGTVIFPVNVSMIAEKSLGGKFPVRSTQFDAVLNMEYFMDLVMDHLPSSLSDAIEDATRDIDTSRSSNRSIYNFATQIYVNLPPNRIDYYMSTDYKDILSNLVDFAGDILYRVGWSQVNVNLDILNSMYGVSYTMLSLSIVLDLVIFVLILLSVGLLYSLLVISVDSKKFMLGVFRMLGMWWVGSVRNGMTKRSLVSFLITQSLGYSVPAYLCGMIIAQTAVLYLTSLLEKKGNVELDGSLSSNAIIIATVVGIGCSLVAAIFPILSALQQNLRDVLDVRHSGTKAVEFNLDRADSMADFSYNVVAVCGSMVLFGWLIYYFFPQSIIIGDLAELAVMLFALLLGMLFGFVLLGINIQHLVELVVVKVILFWERRPIPNIVVKNLIAHRLRNRKTALMYSLSLSFVMMVTVMVHASGETFKISQLRTEGNLKLYINPFNINYLAAMLAGTGEFADRLEDETIHQYVEDFAIQPMQMRYQDLGTHTLDTTTLRNIGQTFGQETWMYAPPSNFESVTPSQFTRQDKGISTSLTGSEQLYTAMGSQRILMGTAVPDWLKLKDLNDPLLIQNEGHQYEWYDTVMSLGWYSMYPYFDLWNTLLWSEGTGIGVNTLIGLSSVPRRYPGMESVEDIKIHAIFIKAKSDVTSSEIAKIKKMLKPYGEKIWDFKVFERIISNSIDMLNLIFNANTYMALFLCLFSLVASMSTNIVEQTKEIGILRSLGLTKFEVNKVYVYEALVLILSSSLIGMVIGCVLTFVIMQQQTLFSSYPVEFYIPGSIVGSVISGALGTSVLSVWFPLKSLGRRQIAQNLRGNL